MRAHTSAFLPLLLIHGGPIRHTKKEGQNLAPGKKGTCDMANKKRLTLLRQGVAVWNQWRIEHPETAIDLRGADLSHANLSYAKLNGADLRSAKLNGADLSEARLYKARLSDADLRGATLIEATLIEATLSGANLNSATLSKADLNKADLRGAELREATLIEAKLLSADLRGAELTNVTLTNVRCGWTMMAEVDLRTVMGLATIEHLGPSRIELHSVQLPSDGSAEVFLRGAGFPEEWIDVYRSTRLSVINYHSLFISYASQDDLLARRLHADLQAKGVRCWFAPHSLEPGDFFREKIDKAIHIQDRVLLLLSEHSVHSKWVAYEVRKAITREIHQQRVVLYPIRIDDTVLHSKEGWAADLRQERHIGNFTLWKDPERYQEVFDQLLKHLQPKT